MNTTSLIWPAVLLLIALLIGRKLGDDIRPLLKAIVDGLAKHASSNAPAYAIAIGFGLSASLAAFIDVFQELTSDRVTALSYHQYAALWAKVLNPFCVAVLAYATQSKFRGGASGTTTPPFDPNLVNR